MLDFPSAGTESERDFGVAKAIDQRLTENVKVTQVGQVVGTLESKSPEQAEFGAADIDTRTHIIRGLRQERPRGPVATQAGNYRAESCTESMSDQTHHVRRLIKMVASSRVADQSRCNFEARDRKESQPY